MKLKKKIISCFEILNLDGKGYLKYPIGKNIRYISMGET